jgi:hypothetical protein
MLKEKVKKKKDSKKGTSFFLIILNYSILVTALLTALGLFIDSYFYPGALLRYAGVDSKIILFSFVLLIYSIRAFGHTLLPEKAYHFNRRFIFPFLLGVSVIFTVLENINYETYVLGKFGFHYDQFMMLPGLAGFLIYMQRDVKKWPFYQKFFYFLAPLYLLLMIVVHFNDEKLFFLITQEDHVIEYLQFFTFALAGIVSLMIVRKLGKKNIELWVFHLILALGLLFVAGEEISWGQRLIGLETPQTLADINYQYELTIHNIRPIQRMMHFVYMAIGLWGVAGRLIIRRLRFIPEKLKPFLAPKYYLLFYFLAVGVFFTFSEYVLWYYEIATAAKIGVHRWQEVSEIYVSTGFLLFTLDNYFRIKKTRNGRKWFEFALKKR